MEKADAPDEAQAFFRQTHWFLDGFRESGIVDIGSVVVLWETDEVFEDSQHAGRKIRFIFQWSLKGRAVSSPPASAS